MWETQTNSKVKPARHALVRALPLESSRAFTLRQVFECLGREIAGRSGIPEIAEEEHLILAARSPVWLDPDVHSRSRPPL